MAGLIITKEGTLPLFTPSFSSSWKLHHSWSSHIASSWTSADTGSTSVRPSVNRFCLKSIPKGHPKGATSCTVAASWPRSPGADYGSTSLGDSASLTILRSPAKKQQLSKLKMSSVRGRKADSKTGSWWDEKLVDANNDVTLALTLQITSAHMKDESMVRNLLSLADSNIFHWGCRQPSILLIHVDSSNEEDAALLKNTLKLIRDTFAPPSNDDATTTSSTSSTTHLKNSLVAVIDSYETTISRKGLLNMATFAAATRWIVSGLELERGLVLSREASVYAGRQAKAYADMTGHVFVLPQFASTRDDTRDDGGGGETGEHRYPEGRVIYSVVGADLLPSIRGKQTMRSNLSEYDCVRCEEEDDGYVDDGVDDEAESHGRRLSDAHPSSSAEKNVDELLEDLWWDLSVADVYGTPGGFNGASETSVGAMAKIHDRIEVSLVSLLDRKGEHLEYLRYFDKSPILMIDRLGPKKEMMTLDLAPEVENFGGRACFHLLRLAQLATLGYKVSVLPGAFAASYPNTREALCNESIRESSTSQCDCELDSESTITQILMDEVKRTAKVAVLMNEVDARLLNSQ